jgi:hypothetical protein
MRLPYQNSFRECQSSEVAKILSGHKNSELIKTEKTNEENFDDYNGIVVWLFAFQLQFKNTG